jgi:hypothetical protein
MLLRGGVRFRASPPVPVVIPVACLMLSTWSHLLEVGCSPDYGYGDEGNYYNQEPQAGSSAPNQRYRGGGGP